MEDDKHYFCVGWVEARYPKQMDRYYILARYDDEQQAKRVARKWNDKYWRGLTKHSPVLTRHTYGYNTHISWDF